MQTQRAGSGRGPRDDAAGLASVEDEPSLAGGHEPGLVRFQRCLGNHPGSWNQEGSALADDLLQRISQTVGEKAKVSTVFGDPVERAGITVIPVAKARFGFGGGGGAGTRERDRGSAGGGGGGAVVSPVGYIEVRDGSARFKRISSPVDLLALVAAASLALIAVRRMLAG
jgi:uncharacterized spore protein YtfJ